MQLTLQLHVVIRMRNLYKYVFNWIFVVAWLRSISYNKCSSMNSTILKRTLVDLPLDLSEKKELIYADNRDSGDNATMEAGDLISKFIYRGKSDDMPIYVRKLKSSKSFSQSEPRRYRQEFIHLTNDTKNDEFEGDDVSTGKTSSEPEECADDDVSSDDKELGYVSGLKEINILTKEDLAAENNKTKGKVKKPFTGNIDLSYLQKLFKGKDVEKFQEDYIGKKKKKAFKKIRQKLYNEESKLKIFENFQSLDLKSERKLVNLAEKKIKAEEENIRYKIIFPSFYHAVGTITLPFDDLVEPFEAWYAGDLNMSRIDYYYGMDKSYQRGDIGPHGVVVKITPAHWTKTGDLDKNTISCWYKEESKWTNRRGQTVIPMNVKKFEYVGEDRFGGVPAHKFRYQKRFGDKNNTYIFHVSRALPYRPLRYEMIGYDHLLRSHYDHYIIDYFSFGPWTFDYKVLQIPKQYKCYEQLRKMKSHFEANPMWDFLHGEEPKPRERELSQTFKDYKQKHSKSYDHHLENHKRKNIFRHNSRFVHSHNRARLNYTLALNHLSDISDQEFEMMKGQPDVDTPQMQKEINDIPQLRLKIPKTPLPMNLDWRQFGAVSKVHSQSFCASCWAFSAIGALEAAFAIQNGSLEELSVQQLVDCSWGYENNGCRGGWSWRALKFVGENGIATRKSYGKYLGQEGYCHCGSKDKCNSIKKISYRTIEKHKSEKLKIALAMFGPGSISVYCARKTFKFYASGIYDDAKCGHKTDHAVVVVGYGEDKGKKYWLIKNSWGTLWGNHGYMKISMKDDLCGVLQNGALMASLLNWKGDSFPFLQMKKLRTVVEAKEFNRLDELEHEIDLFTLPSHVISYMNKKERTDELKDWE